MIACPKCAAANMDHARFCEQCGDDLGPQPKTENGLLTLTVGRNRDNDLVIDLPMISDFHAVLTLEQERIMICDLQTTNGTFVNTLQTRISQPTEVKQSDILFLGSYRLTVKRLLSYAGDPHDKDILYPLGAKPLLLGRDPQCDVVLDHPLISPQHAQITATPSGVLLQALRGANETRVNGESIEACLLNEGDNLMLGPFLLSYTSAGLLQQSSWRQVTLELREASVVVDKNHKMKRKTLLDRISLVVYPGEVCALMGIAGAGKSTLIKTANGNRKPDFGHVYLNGLDLYENYDLFRHSIGYVPQEDITHKDLTVGEALTYAGRLRLGSTFSEMAIQQRVGEVLDQLNMFEANIGIRDVRISQISGGQRRRINIGMELLSDPALFFLDEPLSGLSSEDARAVMMLLRQLADKGKTIIMSLHQPSAEIYAVMDNVIYLHKGGRLVYYGPTVPDSLTFSNPGISPDDLNKPELALRALSSESVAYWQERYKASVYHQEFVSARQQKRVTPSEDGPQHSSSEQLSGFAQWRILLDRNFHIKLNDTLNTLILLCQSPLIAALIALVFSGPEADAYLSTPTVLYLSVISAIWFGCSNAARDICGEWPIYQRERMHHLGVLPYVFAKITTGCFISLIQCILLVAIIYKQCHLECPPDQLILRLWLTSAAGVCLGLLISALASPFKKSNEIAVGLIPIVLLPMIIMGGIIKPYKEMNSTAKLVASMTVTRWSFESNLICEANNNRGQVILALPTGEEEVYSKRKLLLDRFFEEKSSQNSLHGIAAMFLMCLAFALTTAIYLRARDKI